MNVIYLLFIEHFGGQTLENIFLFNWKTLKKKSPGIPVSTGAVFPVYVIF